MATQPKQKPTGAVPVAPKPRPAHRERAIETMMKMGVKKAEAAEHVDAVGGDNEGDVVRAALRRRTLAKQGQVPPPMTTGPAMPSTGAPPSTPTQSQAPPISQAQAAAQFGMPPGGRQAAPSAEQLQAQGAVQRPAVSAVERLTPGQGPGAAVLPPINFGLLPRAQAQAPVTQSPAAPEPTDIRAPSSAAVPNVPLAPAGPTPPVAPIAAPRVGWRVKQMKQPAPAPVEKAQPPEEKVPQRTKQPVGTEAKQPESASRPPIFRSQEEIEQLKSGEQFIWAPTGWVYTKD